MCLFSSTKCHSTQRLHREMGEREREEWKGWRGKLEGWRLQNNKSGIYVSLTIQLTITAKNTDHFKELWNITYTTYIHVYVHILYIHVYVHIYHIYNICTHQ